MSTTSKLLSLFGASVFRHSTNLSPAPPVRFIKLLPSPTIRFHRFCSSAVAVNVNVDTVIVQSTETASDSPHPWPEWVSFVNRLNSKGYFESPSPTTPAVTDEDGVREVKISEWIDYKDINFLKDACLNFARDRYDILKSLSRQDIQTIVEVGCPNLFRKAVNSGKRLRAYLQIDEGDVCGVCNLRGSCDRAYVILKESEAAARTTDIVRILLFYALDPLVISGGEKPSGREIVEASARNLLSDLIVLSDTAVDPALPIPASKNISRKKKTTNLTTEEFAQDVEMKRGDWMCHKCNFMNFARNVQCLKCNEDGPKRVDAKVDANVEMKKGDWICSDCSFMNFSRNIRCLQCKAKGPDRVAVDDVEMKKGDWNCTQCSFMNFSSNRKCLRCRTSRPLRELNPGEWECPKCDFVNFRKNVVCRKCNIDRPRESVTTQKEDRTWRREV